MIDSPPRTNVTALSPATRAIVPDEGLPGTLTETSYVLPPGLTIERWLSIGETLQQMERSIGWWLGDWWNYGKHAYGEMAAQGSKDAVLDQTGRTYETVRQAGRVAKKFEFGERSPDLSWSHHLAASNLPTPKAREVLSEAREARLGVRETKKLAAEELERLRQAEIAAKAPARNISELVSLVAGDAAALPLADATVDCIITSPPYGLDKSYTTGDVEAASWQQVLKVWLAEMYRVAKPGARLALNIPLDTTLGGLRPTYAQAVVATELAGWTYKTTAIWIDDQLGKSTARGSQDSASAPHIVAPAEMILMASKGPWKLQQPADRPSDLAHEHWLQWTHGIWQFPGESNPWEYHPAPFPLELPKRLIYLLTFPDDVVLDPFCGSGTTGLAAIRAKRRFIGVDASPAYLAGAARRLQGG